MANTFWPTSRLFEVPIAIGRSFALGGSTSWSTARSLSSATPTIFAFHTVLSFRVTSAWLPPWMTWKLVTTWPSLSQRNPEPVPCGISCSLRVNRLRRTSTLVTWTTDCDTFLNSSMVDCSSPDRSPRGVTARGSGTGATASGSLRWRSRTTVNTSAPATTSSRIESQRVVAVGPREGGGVDGS
jgi:hypothetical protein